MLHERTATPAMTSGAVRPAGIQWISVPCAVCALALVPLVETNLRMIELIRVPGLQRATGHVAEATRGIR